MEYWIVIVNAKVEETFSVREAAYGYARRLLAKRPGCVVNVVSSKEI